MPRVGPASPANHGEGWLISVHSPGGPWRRYAVVADDVSHAEVLVSDHCRVANEKVHLVRRLTHGEIDRLGLNHGQVKRFAL
jgi:hypothetical protein